MGGAKFKYAAILAGGFCRSWRKRVWTEVAMASGSKCKLRTCLVSSSPLADAGAPGRHPLGRPAKAMAARAEGTEFLTERGCPASATLHSHPRLLLCAVDPAGF